MTDPPRPWPAKLSREQARLVRQRERDFQAVLKARGRASGWRYAQGSLFRQEGEWFVSNMPSLAGECGVWVRLMVKPMRLDELFWEIVGLPENNNLPLSFRDNGAWVLRPEWRVEALAPSEDAVIELAGQVVEWSNAQLSSRPSWSIDAMLAELETGDELHHQKRTLAICLHLLRGDLHQAQHLCRQAGDQRPIDADGGGFRTHHADGTWSTFNQQALEWIAKQRRRKFSAAEPHGTS